jgi:ankyrin repeat protein
MTEAQDKLTSFIQAALSGDTDSLQRMLDDGFDVNQSNTEGETAFSWCCTRNVLVSARFLHANGADVNAPIAGVSSPLDIAVCQASPEFRDWLRSVGGKRLKDFEEWPWPPLQVKQ